MYRLELIERVHTGEGFAYIANLADGEARIRLMLDTDHLLDYRLMQSHVLAQGGAMFVEVACEGRLHCDADRLWKLIASAAIVAVPNDATSIN